MQKLKPQSPVNSEEQEQQLLSLLRDPKGQEKGFRMLMQLYQERLYWHIRTLVQTHDASNEVVQNTFIKAFKGIHLFRSDSKLYTWLYKIATNESLTYLAKEKRYNNRLTFDDNIQANQSTADPYLSSKVTVEALHKAIEELPQKQKIVFNLRYFQEMPYEEMSKILDTSVGALKASYHHAVKKIEAYLRQIVL